MAVTTVTNNQWNDPDYRDRSANMRCINLIGVAPAATRSGRLVPEHLTVEHLGVPTP